MVIIIGEYINATNWVNIIEPESKIDHVNLEFPMTAQNWTWVIRRQFDSSTNNHSPNFTNIDKCNDKLNKPSEEIYQELLIDEIHFIESIPRQIHHQLNNVTIAKLRSDYIKYRPIDTINTDEGLLTLFLVTIPSFCDNLLRFRLVDQMTVGLWNSTLVNFLYRQLLYEKPSLECY